jgi:hypothetical protein
MTVKPLDKGILAFRLVMTLFSLYDSNQRRFWDANADSGKSTLSFARE